jgi:predicted transcriptional regulator
MRLKKPVTIKMDQDLLERLDGHLSKVKSPLGGTVTRTGFIEAAVAQALDREEKKTDRR